MHSRFIEKAKYQEFSAKGVPLRSIETRILSTERDGESAIPCSQRSMKRSEQRVPFSYAPTCKLCVSTYPLLQKHRGVLMGVIPHIDVSLY